MKETKAMAHTLHGAGREDIDARCLDWRPFVFELDSPRKRTLPLKRIQTEINKSGKVKVTDLRPSDKKEVVRVKDLRPDKTYRALIRLEKKIKKEDISSLKKFDSYQ